MWLESEVYLRLNTHLMRSCLTFCSVIAITGGCFLENVALEYCFALITPLMQLDIRLVCIQNAVQVLSN